MNKSNMRRTLSFVAIAFSVLTTLNASANGLQSEMDQLFGQMSNVTMPGVHETQRRGVISGGRITEKTRIFDENLVSFAPPSWKAGCGGVDLYGGSMSFVNSDQIVQLLRSVAANAKGYAFQLALDNVCPECSKQIENFQKKIQSLNEYLGNSCQLAQGVVNDATSSWNNKAKTDASIKSTVTGLYDDVFSAETQSDGKSASENLKLNNPAEYKKLIGNLVWIQLNTNQVSTWFRYGDSAMLEAIMSLTGTVIIGDLVADPNSVASSGNKTNPISYLEGNKIEMIDLMNGGELTIYSCGTDTEQCLTAGQSNGGTKTVNIKGLRTQILDTLLGGNTNPGIVNKFVTGTGSLTNAEKSFMAGLPGGVGGMITNLTKTAPDMVDNFTRETVDIIALYMVYDFAEQFYRVTRIAMSNTDSAYKNAAINVLDRSERKLREEYETITQRVGNLAGVLSHYENIMRVAHKQKIELANTTVSTQEQ